MILTRTAARIIKTLGYSGIPRYSIVIPSVPGRTITTGRDHCRCEKGEEKYLKEFTGRWEEKSHWGLTEYCKEQGLSKNFLEDYKCHKSYISLLKGPDRWKIVFGNTAFSNAFSFLLGEEVHCDFMYGPPAKIRIYQEGRTLKYVQHTLTTYRNVSTITMKVKGKQMEAIYTYNGIPMTRTFKLCQKF